MAHPTETMPGGPDHRDDHEPKTTGAREAAQNHEQNDGGGQTPHAATSEQPAVASPANPNGVSPNSIEGRPTGQYPIQTYPQGPDRRLSPSGYPVGNPQQPNHQAGGLYEQTYPDLRPQRERKARWGKGAIASVVAAAVFAAGGVTAAIKYTSDKAPKAPGASGPLSPGNPNGSHPESNNPDEASPEMDPALQQLIEKFHLQKRDAGKYAEGTGDFGEKHKDIFPTTYYDLSPLAGAQLSEADRTAFARLIFTINWPAAVNTNNLNLIDPSKRPDDAPTQFGFIVNYFIDQTLLGWPKSGQAREIAETQLRSGLIATDGSDKDGNPTLNIGSTTPLVYTGAPYTISTPGVKGKSPESVIQITKTGDEVTGTVFREPVFRYDPETLALTYYNMGGLGENSFIQP